MSRIWLGWVIAGSILLVVANAPFISLSVIPQTISGNQIICLPSSAYGSFYASLCGGTPSLGGAILTFNWSGSLLSADQAAPIYGVSSACGAMLLYSSNLPTGTAPFGTNYGTRWNPSYGQTYISDPNNFYACSTSQTTSGTSSAVYSSTITSTTGTTYTLSVSTSVSSVTSTTAVTTTTVTVNGPIARNPFSGSQLNVGLTLLGFVLIGFGVVQRLRSKEAES